MAGRTTKQSSNTSTLPQGQQKVQGHHGRRPPKDRSASSTAYVPRKKAASSQSNRSDNANDAPKKTNPPLRNASASGQRNNAGLSDDDELEFDPNENIDDGQKKKKVPLPTRGHRKKGLSDDSDSDDDFDQHQKRKAPYLTRGRRKKGLSDDSDSDDDFDPNEEHETEGQKKKKAKQARNYSNSTTAQRTSPHELTPRQFSDPYLDPDNIDIDAAGLDNGMLSPSLSEIGDDGSSLRAQSAHHLRSTMRWDL